MGDGNPEWIDQDDAPQITDAFFERADEYRGGTWGRHGRPPAEATQERRACAL
jgi:hypothetical protein